MPISRAGARNCLLITISVQTVILRFLRKTLQEMQMVLKTLSFGAVGLMGNMLDIFGRLGVWQLENAMVCSKSQMLYTNFYGK